MKQDMTKEEAIILAWYKRVIYSQGDSYSCRMKGEKCIVSHSNDYPMQHGYGSDITLEGEVLEAVLDGTFDSKYIIAVGKKGRKTITPLVSDPSDAPSLPDYSWETLKGTKHAIECTSKKQRAEVVEIMGLVDVFWYLLICCDDVRSMETPDVGYTIIPASQFIAANTSAPQPDTTQTEKGDLLDDKNDIDTVGKCANCGVEFHIHKPASAPPVAESTAEAGKIAEKCFPKTTVSMHWSADNVNDYREALTKSITAYGAAQAVGFHHWTQENHWNYVPELKYWVKSQGSFKDGMLHPTDADLYALYLNRDLLTQNIQK